MKAIFEMRCDKAGYRLDPGAGERLLEILREESEDNIGFGNARGVRNLFEQAISRQANRLAKKDVLTRYELMTLTREDLEAPGEAGEDEAAAETEAAPNPDS